MRGAAACVIVALSALGARADAASPARVHVEAGAKTAALSQLLREQGLTELVDARSAELSVTLVERGASWSLSITDRSGAALVRREIRASGLAALRVVAVLVEQAVRARQLRPTRSATVAGAGDGVRAVPPLPVPETALPLLRDASALPRRSTSATAAPALDPLTRGSTLGAAPSDARGADGSAAVTGGEGTTGASPAAESAAAASVPELAAGGEVAVEGAPGDGARASAASPGEDPGGDVEPEEADVVAARTGPAAPSEGAGPDADERRGAPAPVARAGSSSLGGAPVVRAFIGARAQWWALPADLPQLAFHLGVEALVGPVWLGAGAQLAGAPCCVRSGPTVEANALEIGGLVHAAISAYDNEVIGFIVFSELGLTYATGDARVLGPGESAAATPLEGVLFGLTAGPGLELRLGARASFRLRAGVRLGLASLRVDAPPGVGGESIDSGRVNPMVDLSFPLNW